MGGPGTGFPVREGPLSRLVFQPGIVWTDGRAKRGADHPMTTSLCDAAGRGDHASRGDVARIFALSDRQSALLWHLVETGGLREAARAMGCSYISAR
ncbi:MAG TPA: hypothetical protein PKC32_08215, partial [Sphingopyxis sp.]|nr:hypothetical protein [Sphingopyxis sp.]